MKTLIILAAALAASSLVAFADGEPIASCVEVEPDPGRGTLHVRIEKEAGRLEASVVLEAENGEERLMQRDGVERRTAPGRELDVLYVGNELTLATSSTTDDGRLTWLRDGRETTTLFDCAEPE